jgi:hypothetical protein
VAGTRAASEAAKGIYRRGGFRIVFRNLLI